MMLVFSHLYCLSGFFDDWLTFQGPCPRIHFKDPIQWPPPRTLRQEARSRTLSNDPMDPIQEPHPTLNKKCFTKFIKFTAKLFFSISNQLWSSSPVCWFLAMSLSVSMRASQLLNDGYKYMLQIASFCKPCAVHMCNQDCSRRTKMI